GITTGSTYILVSTNNEDITPTQLKDLDKLLGKCIFENGFEWPMLAGRVGEKWMTARQLRDVLKQAVTPRLPGITFANMHAQDLVTELQKPALALTTIFQRSPMALAMMLEAAAKRDSPSSAAPSPAGTEKK